MFMTTVRRMALAIGLLGMAVGCGGGGTTGGGTGTGGGAIATGGSGGAGTGGATGGAGGGGTTTVTHCDINNLGTQECIEYSPGFPSAQQGCAVLTGTYSTGHCDLTNSSGGCKQLFGSDTQIVYYYTPTVTADAVMAQCVNDGNATYVAP
jgi:hypothetical protein